MKEETENALTVCIAIPIVFLVGPWIIELAIKYLKFVHGFLK